MFLIQFGIKKIGNFIYKFEIICIVFVFQAPVPSGIRPTSSSAPPSALGKTIPAFGTLTKKHWSHFYSIHSIKRNYDKWWIQIKVYTDRICENVWVVLQFYFDAIPYMDLQLLLHIKPKSPFNGNIKIATETVLLVFSRNFILFPLAI